MVMTRRGHFLGANISLGAIVVLTWRGGGGGHFLATTNAARLLYLRLETII